MGNFLQFLANNLQLLFFIAVAIIPAIGAVVRWAEKQREERRRMAEMERRRLEALRTGRVEILQTTMQAPQTTMPAPATARQEEAVRRQREMQERMRQRLEQQRRQQQATARPRPAPTTQRPGPAPTTQRPGPARQRPAPPARRPAAPRPAGRQPGAERERKRQAPPEIAPQTLIETPTLVSTQEIGVRRAEPPAARARVVPRVGPGMTVQQLREAIVLRELLDRPLALRERGPGPDLFD
ncbi:MAG: hypothetical protein ACF8R7_19010 [Phycisphaerales bacterium JB039]